MYKGSQSGGKDSKSLGSAGSGGPAANPTATAAAGPVEPTAFSILSNVQLPNEPPLVSPTTTIAHEATGVAGAAADNVEHYTKQVFLSDTTIARCYTRADIMLVKIIDITQPNVYQVIETNAMMVFRISDDYFAGINADEVMIYVKTEGKFKLDHSMKHGISLSPMVNFQIVDTETGPKLLIAGKDGVFIADVERRTHISLDLDKLITVPRFGVMGEDLQYRVDAHSRLTHAYIQFDSTLCVAGIINTRNPKGWPQVYRYAAMSTLTFGNNGITHSIKESPKGYPLDSMKIHNTSDAVGSIEYSAFPLEYAEYAMTLKHLPHINITGGWYELNSQHIDIPLDFTQMRAILTYSWITHLPDGAVRVEPFRHIREADLQGYTESSNNISMSLFPPCMLHDGSMIVHTKTGYRDRPGTDHPQQLHLVNSATLQPELLYRFDKPLSQMRVNLNGELQLLFQDGTSLALRINNLVPQTKEELYNTLTQAFTTSQKHIIPLVLIPTIADYAFTPGMFAVIPKAQPQSIDFSVALQKLVADCKAYPAERTERILQALVELKNHLQAKIPSIYNHTFFVNSKIQHIVNQVLALNCVIQLKANNPSLSFDHCFNQAFKSFPEAAESSKALGEWTPLLPQLQTAINAIMPTSSAVATDSTTSAGAPTSTVAPMSAKSQGK